MNFLDENDKNGIEENIEELIFKINGDWVCGMQTQSGCVLRVKVNFNPWTGEKLD